MVAALTFHAFLSLKKENGDLMGPKDWKRSPWEPGSQNGDPLGSNATAVNLERLRPNWTINAHRKSATPKFKGTQCWAKSLWAKLLGTWRHSNGDYQQNWILKLQTITLCYVIFNKYTNILVNIRRIHFTIRDEALGTLDFAGHNHWKIGTL